MRKLALGLALGAALISTPAHAVIGVLDDVPAATVLVPYFEVDLSGSTRDTLIAVQNTAAIAALMHVTIWSDAGVPVYGFNTYLTGYDQQSIDLHDILVGGKLPQTASAGQDPTDTISPKGKLSQDINYASCTGVLPPAALDATTLGALQAALTGKSSTLAGGQCAGLDHGDKIARGYVTIDTVNNCTTRNPGDTGYFAAGGTGDVTNQNLLVGEYVLVDNSTMHAQSFHAVQIEADSSNPISSTSGSYTFYGRSDGWTAVDNREPLATNWGAQYLLQDTDVIVWRDPKVPASGFTCGQSPSYYPLGAESVLAFDMQESVTDFTSAGSFPAAANRVHVGDVAFPTTNKLGWMFFNGNTTVNGVAMPPSDPAAAQSFVQVIEYPRTFGPTLSALGTSQPAIQLDGAANASHTSQPIGWFDVTTHTYHDGNANHTIALGDANLAPAATLLLPYFEVDTVNRGGVDTILTVSSTSATASLAHVTLWTDYGVPSYVFNVYLTGYDVSEIDLRLLFQNGLVEQTASAGQDPSDRISPHGPLSQDINFASCNGLLPPPRMSAAAQADLVAAHTGKGTKAWGGRCGGSVYGDAIARGFVTIDTVNNCTLRKPGDAGYFNPGGTGDATDQNLLTGSYTVLDRTNKLAYAEPMVHIEASSTDPSTTTAGNETFYGRFVGWSASDNREPLGHAWQVRYVNNAPSSSVWSAFGDGKTSLVAWRDSAVATQPFTCGQTPTGFPLSQKSALVFDEQENVTDVSTLAPFPVMTRRVAITDPTLGVPYASGFFVLDLDSNAAGGGAPSNPNGRQAYVFATHLAKAAGYEVSLPAFQLQ